MKKVKIYVYHFENGQIIETKGRMTKDMRKKEIQENGQIIKESWYEVKL